MKVKIEKFYGVVAKDAKTNIICASKFRIYTYKFSINEIALDNFLRETKNIGLRVACKKIVDNTELVDSSENDYYIALFPNKSIDELATLITYGNGKLQGSKILSHIFNV